MRKVKKGKKVILTNFQIFVDRFTEFVKFRLRNSQKSIMYGIFNYFF